ncbi:MAG: T9SS type A sorting domain-containing protein [Bacteroidales bacterium]|nr:T9SS type A sorting domain-containing protein [Bacteroidales bacterium]
MRKLTTLSVLSIFFFFSSHAQRLPHYPSEVLAPPQLFIEKNLGPDTLLPGNWETATGVAMHAWSDNNGYFFGTNSYGDIGYGQRFDVTEPYEILKAIFWIGARLGETGEVVFSIWDFKGTKPGEVLASVAVSMSEINASQEFEQALVVEFDEPVTVTGNYLIGADISGLNPFEPDVYALGNYASTQENGTNLGYAYIKEGSQWVSALNFELDVDIAIFPIVNYVEAYSVTLNLDMTGVENFDPEENKVFVSGNFNQWIEPGTPGSIEMAKIPRENEEDPLIYSCTLPFVRVGEMLYKYYSDAIGQGWEGAEWENDSNRSVFIDQDIVLNDIWANLVVGVDEIMAQPIFRVFPNPASHSIHVNGKYQLDYLRIFDLQGKLIFQKEILGDEASVNISSWQQGLYLLQLISGSQTSTHKIWVIHNNL